MQTGGCLFAKEVIKNLMKESPEEVYLKKLYNDKVLS